MGVMTSEYLTQMKPVAARADRAERKGKSESDETCGLYLIRHAPTFCDTLSFSAGRCKSFNPAATRHHFITGAQKNTVFGPVAIQEGKRVTAYVSIIVLRSNFS